MTGMRKAWERREPERGREAEAPSEIPPLGWLDIGWRVIRRLRDDRVALAAAALAMYALMAVFPGLAVLVSIYGAFTSPGDVMRHMSAFAGLLPPGVWDMIARQLQGITRQGQTTLTLAASLGLATALWSTRSAMSSLMTATNIAYREREKRGWIRQILVSVALTLGALLGFIAVLVLGIAVPVALQVLGMSASIRWAALAVRLAILWCLAVTGLAVVYRYAPARERAQWRWVTWGSAVAATLWFGATAVFSYYVHAFGSFGRSYGALGGAVVMLIWFYISGYIAIIGGLVNAEMERQTRKDSTIRGGAPLGKRGAFAADTVGPKAGSGYRQRR